MKKSHAVMLAAVLLSGAPSAQAGEDAAARALRQQALQREQHQQELRLRMQQQDKAARFGKEGGQASASRERDDTVRRQRQEADHYRERIERPARDPADDAGTREAKEAIRRLDARREDAAERPAAQ